MISSHSHRWNETICTQLSNIEEIKINRLIFNKDMSIFLLELDSSQPLHSSLDNSMIKLGTHSDEICCIVSEGGIAVSASYDIVIKSKQNCSQ